MSTLTVTKVGVLSVGKFTGTVNLIIALAVGLFGAVIGTITYVTSDSHEAVEGLLGSLAIIIGAVVLYPLVMFAIGWIYGVVAAFIFNVVIGVSGGLELTVKEGDVR
jgi:homoaconitase/3-isopropylmalate dehydratase large subunit